MWNLAIRRGVTFGMLFLAIVGIGIVSLLRLSPELLPDVSLPVAGVIASYSGVGPEDVENLVTKPIEAAVATATNLSQLTSIVREGQSITLLEFAWGTDMDVAAADIREKVDLVRGFLPDEVDKPLVVKFDPTMWPIMVIAVSGELPTWELRRIAEDEIAPRIERIDGVASAMSVGGLKREIQVNLDARKLKAYGVSFGQVTQAVGAANLSYPGGTVGVGTREHAVRTRGEFETLREIENLIISYPPVQTHGVGGSPVRVKHLADVQDAFEDRLADTRVNGKPAVAILVHKTSGAVTVDVSTGVKRELSRTRAELPPGVAAQLVMDQAEYINKAIGNLVKVALFGVMLAVSVLFAFLVNFRSTAIIAVAIPVSVIGAFVAMDGLGITLNMISMMGLALAIGMLVDSAIVVLENVFRHREDGMGMREAASHGTGEVAVPITASVMTTISVFFPIVFVPGIVGIMFRDLSLTVTVSLLVSLFVALALIPLLCSRFLRLTREAPRTGGPMDRWVDRWVGRGINRLEGRVKGLFSGLTEAYGRLLGWCLDHKRRVVFGTVGLFFFSLLMVWPLRFVGTEFLPKTDQGAFTLSVECPPGTKLEVTEGVVAGIERVLAQEISEIRTIHSTVGGSGMAVMLGGGGRTHRADLDVELVDLPERDRTQWEVEEAIRPELLRIPGVEITFRASQHGMMMQTSEAPISVEIYGHDLDRAEVIAKQVRDIVTQVPGTRDVEVSLEKALPEFNVTVDRDRASALGLPVAVVADAISSAMAGKVATRLRQGGDEFNIRVRLRPEDRESVEDLINIPISTPLGEQVSLSAIAHAEPAMGPLAIERKGQERLVTVSCDYAGRDLGSVVREIEGMLAGIPLPPDFSIKLGGEAEEQRESFRWLALALMGAIFLVYMVMASLFESLIDPFIIMLTFPLAVIGVIWFMFLTNTTFSVIAFIGLVLLAGIIVNNGIVMVHYISLIRKRDGLGLREAVLLGGRRRLRPVLMTALTTIFAMVPMAMGLGAGAEIRMPMARAVIGGLVVGTVLTLIVIPVMYTIFETIALRRRKVT